MNDLMRYPFGTISKSFYSGLPFRLFMVYLLLPPPLPFNTYKGQRTETRRRERKDKNTGGGSERHK